MPSPLKQNLILLFLIALADNLQAADKPDQVIEFFRHGARSPIFKYDLSWPQSDGVLTTVGMLQHYDLGKKLAERYPHLVESGYNPDDVYVLSNFVPRCIESALAHVSSMFRGRTSTLNKENPQKDQQESIIERITPHLPENESDRGEFVPIKVDIVSGREQEFIFNGRNQHWCPIVGKYRQENENSAEISQGWDIFKDPVNKANSFLPSSQHITNMAVLNHAFDAFIADIYENKTLPGNINDMILIESLNYGQAYYQELQEHLQPIQKGLTSFPTLNAIVEQLKNFREGKSPKRLAMFSGHDLNIYAILSAFGIVSTECLLANYQDYIQEKPLSFPNCQYPKFASNLIFEFYNDTTNPYVKFYYNDVLIPLCDGQESCTYDEFLSFINKAGGSHTLQIWTDTCNGKTIIQEEEKGPNQDNQNSETQDKQENEATKSQENKNDKTEESSSSNRENENSETKIQSDNQKSETVDKNSNQENKEDKENEDSEAEAEPEEHQSINQKDQNEDQNSDKENDENTDPEENQTPESQDKNSDKETDETTDPEPQEDQSSSHKENQNADFDPQTEQTTSIKTIESDGGVNKWLIVGASVMAALALTVTLKTCIKYKWWNPFRRFKKDDMFKQHDEIEV